MPARFTPRRAQRLRNAAIALGALLWIASLIYPPVEYVNSAAAQATWKPIGHRLVWRIVDPIRPAPPGGLGFAGYYRPNWPTLLFEWSCIAAIVAVPYWLIGLITSRDPARCRACGYDLAGIAAPPASSLKPQASSLKPQGSSITCPECGEHQPTPA